MKVNRQVGRYFQLKSKQKEIEQELQELRTEILAYYEEQGVTEATVGNFQVKLVKQERKEYNDTRLSEALPDPQLWRLLSKPDLSRIASLLKLKVITEDQLKDTFVTKHVTLLQIDKR
ncbi:hypothetical protein D3P07_02280 [Paenibacillus sp. 1011MAR3C5]|uniref:hypothetical protein n=1 Tax=Paenibacillus sp. 1011MAR3C5 TaxID=1675787 RepID=UPI000E6B780D|nr:hypothetical protein [Paenibacillus sp. 1011MAR3C5]RJE91410.1 hypothetical protein D3P07_02280 [Paenibacillus sp. 1011MAR3C5]